MKRMLALLIVVLLPSAAMAADVVKDTSYVTTGSSRVLRHEIIVKASASEAWAALATAEGWRTWAAPYAVMTPTEFAFDAELITSYNPDARPEDDTNIHQRILSYIPERMLSFHTARPPKGFAHPAELSKLFVVVELEPIDAKATRIRLSMLGYGAGPGFDEIYGFFSKGNAWTLQKLAERFETGPVDWKKALAKPAH